jgi:hypothetical protein
VADIEYDLHVRIENSVDLTRTDANAFSSAAIAELMNEPAAKGERFVLSSVSPLGREYSATVLINTEKREAAVTIFASRDDARSFTAKVAAHLGLTPAATPGTA